MKRLVPYALFAFSALHLSSAWPAEPKIVLDLSLPRGQIRAALLERMPLSSSAPVVLNFINQHLRHGLGDAVVSKGPAPEKGAAKSRGAKFIRLYLGQYLDHPEVVFLAGPLLSQREVSAIWIFDEKDRLIDLVVDKRTGIY